MPVIFLTESSWMILRCEEKQESFDIASFRDHELKTTLKEGETLSPSLRSCFWQGYLKSFFLPNPARPIKPHPKSNRVDGSGTDLVSIFASTPVL